MYMRHAEPYDEVLADLCTTLLASLPRADQRTKGVEYLRGLLLASGRKTIRNIAALADGPAAEQSLHHFISDSTWDWVPVRRALTRYLTRRAEPQAWVVRPMVIPKAGTHSVGVGRFFSQSLGQTLNAQQAVGVWAVSDELAGPVGWRLHLSRAWLEDNGRRSRASIPDDVGLESFGDCATNAFLEMAGRAELPVRPVVLDARETDTVSAIGNLRAAGVPVLARIAGSLGLAASDLVLPGYHAGTVPAHQIMAAAKDLRCPVTWTDAGSAAVARTSLAATVRVGVPGDGRPTELLLLGVGDIGRPWPEELWLTDLTTARPATLVRLSRFAERVDRDFTEIADRVGIRDFSGRSFGGWHRHVTLASAAHAVVAVAATTATGMRQVS